MLTVGVDAGGTRTSVALVSSTQRRSATFESVNPASVGDEMAYENLREVVEFIAQESCGGEARGWVGSAAFDKTTAHRERRRLLACLSERGVRGRFILSNDAIVPLLAPPLNGVGLVVIVGTGSVVIGRNSEGQFQRAGGYEYLLSDRGGAFDVGLRGLRAAAEADDEQGPATSLSADALQVYGEDARACGRTLAFLPYPKKAVARFAGAVCQAACAGDSVAKAIVEAAAADIAAAAEVVYARLLRGVTASTVLCGGLAFHYPSYREAIFAHLQQVGALACRSIPDAVEEALSLGTAVDRGDWLEDPALTLAVVEAN